MPLVHRVVAPRRPSTRPPLLVLLHGIGADEEDLLPLVPHLDPRFLVLSVRAPLQAPPLGHAWYAIDYSSRPPVSDAAQAAASRDLLLDFLAGAVIRHAVDLEKIFLFGFSQGAVMAYAAALARPDLVRGLVAHSGRLLPETLAEPRATPELERSLDRLEVLVLHGDEDEVIPVARGREAVEALRTRLGQHIAWRSYPGLGHGISPESLETAAAWLTGHLDA